MITYTYRIYGEPLVHLQEKEGRGRLWTTYKQDKVKALISLEGQHNNRPLLTGPVALEIEFYSCGQWEKNEISRYIKFVECLLLDIAYNTPQQVAAVTARRHHGLSLPFTNIILTEIEDE